MTRYRTGQPGRRHWTVPVLHSDRDTNPRDPSKSKACARHGTRGLATASTRSSRYRTSPRQWPGHALLRVPVPRASHASRRGRHEDRAPGTAPEQGDTRSTGTRDPEATRQSPCPCTTGTCYPAQRPEYPMTSDRNPDAQAPRDRSPRFTRAQG